jgi:hypothetical protein
MSLNTTLTAAVVGVLESASDIPDQLGGAGSYEHAKEDVWKVRICFSI